MGWDEAAKQSKGKSYYWAPTQWVLSSSSSSSSPSLLPCLQMVKMIVRYEDEIKGEEAAAPEPEQEEQHEKDLHEEEEGKRNQ